MKKSKKFPELTVKQAQIFEFLVDYKATNGTYAPLQVTADKFDVALGTMQDHIAALHRKGFLETVPGRNGHSFNIGKLGLNEVVSELQTNGSFKKETEQAKKLAIKILQNF